MKYEIVTLFDTAAKIYSRPMYLTSLRLVERFCLDILAGESDVSRHPSDFVLFHLGQFDDCSAEMSLLPAPKAIRRLHEVDLPPEGLGLIHGDTLSSSQPSVPSQVGTVVKDVSNG